MPCALPIRSEEHTSELQSPCNLVCRLLLEKKKTNGYPCPRYSWPLLLALHVLPHFGRAARFHQHRAVRGRGGVRGHVRDVFFFFLMIRRPPRSTLFPYHDALPICIAKPVTRKPISQFQAPTLGWLLILRYTPSLPIVCPRLNLTHCDDWRSVMASSHAVEWIGPKESALCANCQSAVTPATQVSPARTL